jgi:ABC-type transport system involved in multi-copper enzyme maturation permease subunit
MKAVWTIAQLTLHEASRRRILLALILCAAAFLVLFAIGIHFVARDVGQSRGMSMIERRSVLIFITLAGLYAANFLIVMTSVLLPVDTLSGEIGSGVMQTLASKPIRRLDIVLGKWLGFAGLSATYAVLVAGGVLGLAWLVARVTLPGVDRGVPLMVLESWVLLGLVLAGGARLSTITTGVVAFGFYTLAFIGSWVEQIGTFAGNLAARNVGTAASLIMPTEALWQLAAHSMQPPLMRDLAMTPFSPASVPSPAMVMWAAGHALLTLVLAMRWFQQRPL